MVVTLCWLYTSAWTVGEANTFCVPARGPTCQGIDVPRHYQHTTHMQKPQNSKNLKNLILTRKRVHKLISGAIVRTANNSSDDDVSIVALLDEEDDDEEASSLGTS
jgi:hypothetical protein